MNSHLFDMLKDGEHDEQLNGMLYVLDYICFMLPLCVVFLYVPWRSEVSLSH